MDNRHKKVIRTEKLDSEKSGPKERIPETKAKNPGSNSGSALYANSLLVTERKSSGANKANVITSKTEVTKNHIEQKPGNIYESQAGPLSSDSGTLSKINQKGPPVDGAKLNKRSSRFSFQFKSVKTKPETKNPGQSGLLQAWVYRISINPFSSP
jgi:hypothetical protein